MGREARARTDKAYQLGGELIDAMGPVLSFARRQGELLLLFARALQGGERPTPEEIDEVIKDWPDRLKVIEQAEAFLNSLAHVRSSS